MHGVGTFEAPNGARYQGGWALNVKHGLGKQSFSNGDVYEGIWKNGVPDGPGRYKVSRILNSDRRSGDEVRLPNQSNTARCSLGTSPSMRIRRVCGVSQIPITPLPSPYQVVRTHQTNPITPLFPPPTSHPPTKWCSGCEYDGEWRAGRCHGQGNYAWPCGEKYDGEWKVGLREA